MWYIFFFVVIICYKKLFVSPKLKKTQFTVTYPDRFGNICKKNTRPKLSRLAPLIGKRTSTIFLSTFGEEVAVWCGLEFGGFPVLPALGNPLALNY
jgi:hypothetical protein